MTRRVALGDVLAPGLVDTDGAARAAGMARQTFVNLRHDPGVGPAVPQPHATVAGAGGLHVYRKDDIEAWARYRHRKLVDAGLRKATPA